MSPEHAAAYLPEVNRLLSGSPFEKVDTPIFQFVNQFGFYSSSAPKDGEGTEEYVVVMSIRGPLLKDDVECGPRGMETMDQRLKNILSRNDVKGVVLDIDSPGGQACYMPLFAHTIKSAKKPIVAYYNSLCCSAAYGLASQAREIYASCKTDIVGSVGTFITLADVSAYYDKMGIKLHEVYADASTNKNGVFMKALKGDYKPIKDKLLNPVNENFIASVRAARNITNEEVFTGETYLSEEAIQHGVIDGIKSLSESIARVFEIAEEEQENSSSSTLINQSHNPQTNINMKQKIMLVAAFLGYESLESKEGHVSLSEADVAKLAGLLPNASADANGATEETDEVTAPVAASPDFTALMESLEKVNSTIEGLGGKISSMESRVEAVEKRPAGAAASVVAKPTTETDDALESEFNFDDASKDPLSKAALG